MIYWRAVRPLILLIPLAILASQSIFADARVHLVVRGDTIFSLSRLYNVSQDELMRRNGMSSPSQLQAGMRLVIPGAAGSPAASSRGHHTVRAGETLYSLARGWGVTLQALRDANGLSRNHVLRAGERLVIPGQTAAPPSNQPAASVPVQRNIARPPPRPLDSSIRWPVTAREVLYMNSNMGVLVTGVESESIKSLSRGTVIHASPWRGYGYVAIVESNGGYNYLYGAFASLSVRKGDRVEPGTELGKLGIYPATGKPDLVLIVSRNGASVDPATAPRS